MEYIDIEIRKPVYGTFCYIRDKFIKQARDQGKMLRITVPQGVGIVHPDDWMLNAKRLEKEFKIKGQPMILYGNTVEVLEGGESNE